MSVLGSPHKCLRVLMKVSKDQCLRAIKQVSWSSQTSVQGSSFLCLRVMMSVLGLPYKCLRVLM